VLIWAALWCVVSRRYKCRWLLVIGLAPVVLVAVLTLGPVSAVLLVLAVEYYGTVMLAVLLWGGLWLAAGLILRRRWPLFVAPAPIALLVTSVLLAVSYAMLTRPQPTIWLLTVLGIIPAIGVWKLIVASVGKRNVYAGSRLKAADVQAPPRGMVE
jgi:hypothetical protein